MNDSPHFPNSFYRVTIKGLCVRDEKLLLIRESEAHSGQKWQLPGGGLDFGEEIKAGFEREIAEEMGLVVTKMSKNPLYIWPTQMMQGKNIGWYYTVVLAYRVKFENLDFTPTHECEEIAFFSKDELPKLKLSSQMEKLPQIFNSIDFVQDF